MKIEIIADIDLWPGTKNGHRVMVTYNDGKQMEQLMHKTEVKLHEHIQELKKKLNPIEIKKLEAMFTEYGEYKYDEAAQDAANDAAGADM